MLTREITLEELMEVYKEDAREQGLEQGLEQGRKEEKMRNARNLKTNGVEIRIIANSLGLTPQEVLAI